MDKNQFEHRMATAATDHAGGVRSNLTQLSGEIRAADAVLRDKQNAAGVTEPGGDPQVGLESHAIQSTNPEP